MSERYLLFTLTILPFAFFAGPFGLVEAEVEPLVYPGLGVQLEPKQITFSELREFMDISNVKNISRNNSFVCTDYSNEFIKSLWEDERVFSCQATIYIKPNMAHALVAVNTSDKGTVYVDVEQNKILYKTDVLFYWNVKRVTSCFGRFEPGEYTCIYIGKEKRCY